MIDKEIFLCSICNVNSGTCNEDCKFCSQSVRYKADIDRYIQKDMDIILQEAKTARDNGALGFCLVTADKGITPKSLKFVCDIAKMLTKEVPELRPIACNGTANLEQLLTLKEAGIKAYNHNLETSEAFYPQICTTHPWSERYATCRAVNESGLVLITGGIFEIGFSDTIQQMWAAFIYELVEGKPKSHFAACVTPDEVAYSHRLLTAALKSQKNGTTEEV